LPHLQAEIATAADLVDGNGVDVVARGAFVLDPVLGAGTPRSAGASVVWHAARGEILAFGGANENDQGFTCRMLRLEGERWVPVDVEGILPPANEGVAVYDPAGERLILVQRDGQTWFFEGDQWRAFSGALPPQGAEAAVVYEERRRGVVRFGGREPSGTGRSDETWFFDGDAWRELVLPTSPPARSSAAMAFDRVDGCLILRGGRDAAGLRSDLWRLDNEDWHLIDEGAPFNPTPTLEELQNPPNSVSYAGGVAVTDPVSGRVQFVGGSFSSQFLAGNLATFDGEGLVNGPALGGSVVPGAAWDLRRLRLVVLGGRNPNLGGGGALADFLILEGGVVRRALEQRRPPDAAESAAAVYDGSADRTVFFGGIVGEPPNAVVLTSTRSWDGASSTTLVGGNGLLPFGGVFFDGATVGGTTSGSLLALTDAGWGTVGALPSGAPTSSIAFAYHAGGDVAFGFGGSGADGLSDVAMTIRDGVASILTPTTRPPARRSASIVYDAFHDRVVLYGGIVPSQLRDTWVYEGDDWRQLDADTGAGVGVATLVYDDVRDVVVRVGEGAGAAALVIDEMRDDRWQRRDVFVPGQALAKFNAVYDTARRRTLVQGGFADGGTRADVLAWDGDVFATPAVVMAVDLLAREAGATVLRSIDVVAVAGATGADLAGVEAHGVDVLVWGDAWERVGDGGAGDADDAGFGDAADIAVHIDDTATLNRIAKDRFVVAVAGSAPSGAGPGAALHVDALEVTVSYREE